MSAPRTKFIDPDNRRAAKTDRFCVRCNKDIKPSSPARSVHLVNGGLDILHPEDEAIYTSDAGDCGAFLVGMDCANRIGLEWTTPG